MCILNREDNVRGRYPPVDGERRVIPSYSSLRMGSIVAITFVLKDSIGAQHTEPMGKATRDKKHPIILFR